MPTSLTREKTLELVRKKQDFAKEQTIKMIQESQGTFNQKTLLYLIMKYDD